MGAYDSEGFRDEVPGGAGGWDTFQPPGSTPEAESPPAGQAVTTGVGTGLLRTESVDPNDTAMPNQAAQYDSVERISGVGGIGSTGAGEGHAGHFRHPNSMTAGAS